MDDFLFAFFRFRRRDNVEHFRSRNTFNEFGEEVVMHRIGDAFLTLTLLAFYYGFFLRADLLDLPVRACFIVQEALHIGDQVLGCAAFHLHRQEAETDFARSHKAFHLIHEIGPLARFHEAQNSVKASGLPH